MAKKVSMQDIADRLKISRMTVSKSFKNDSDISKEMKDKVRLMAQELGYQYTKYERFDLVVLVPEIFLSKTEAFYSTLYKRLGENALTKNIRLMLHVVNKSVERNLVVDFDVLNKDGIMMMGQFDKDYVVAVEKLKMPLVCVDFYYDDLALDSIVSNNYNAGYIATKYLIHKGHQKIGFVGTIQATNSIMDRYLGYYKALIEKELPRSDDFVIDDRDPDGEMIDFKLPSDLPTAFLCNNDHVAYLLAEKLKSMSIHVPNDVSIIGFDDVIYSRISNPQITTMKVSRTYMAEQAIKLILRRIRSKDAKLINMTLECIMVERDSVNQ